MASGPQDHSVASPCRRSGQPRPSGHDTSRPTGSVAPARRPRPGREGPATRRRARHRSLVKAASGASTGGLRRAADQYNPAGAALTTRTLGGAARRRAQAAAPDAAGRRRRRRSVAMNPALRSADGPRVLAIKRNVSVGKWNALQFECQDVGEEVAGPPRRAPARRAKHLSRAAHRVKRAAGRGGAVEPNIEELPISGEYDLFFAYSPSRPTFRTSGASSTARALQLRLLLHRRDTTAMRNLEPALPRAAP